MIFFFSALQSCHIYHVQKNDPQSPAQKALDILSSPVVFFSTGSSLANN